MELNNEDRRMLKPRIVRNENGRWFVRSPSFPDGEGMASFWEYWDLATLALAWCTERNEDQAWVQWSGRANRGD